MSRSVSKNKILKTKKKKKVFDKLGVTNLFQDVNKKGHSMKGDIDDLIKTPPSIVCARALETCGMVIGNSRVSMKKNEEIVIPLGLFFQGQKDKTTNMRFLKPATRPFSERFRRYRGEDLTSKKLLVWRFGGIGDLMFAQPLLMFLKSKYPGLSITFATSPGHIEIFNNWPIGIIDRAIPMPFSATYLDNTDYHLTFEGAIERCKEAHTLNSIDIFSKIANITFDANEYQTKLLDNKAITLKVQRYIPNKTIALQVRASSPIRTFTMTKTIELVNLLTDIGFNVGFIDSKKMAPEIQKLINNKGTFKNRDKILNLAFLSDDLNHCISILNCCSGAIATDSSITHLSSALGKPTVGVYGPFLGELRMKYYKTGDWVNTPDSWNGCGKCPCFFHENELNQCPYLVKRQQIGCMNSIDVNNVVDKFITLYENNGEKEHDGLVAEFEALLSRKRPI